MVALMTQLSYLSLGTRTPQRLGRIPWCMHGRAHDSTLLSLPGDLHPTASRTDPPAGDSTVPDLNIQPLPLRPRLWHRHAEFLRGSAPPHHDVPGGGGAAGSLVGSVGGLGGVSGGGGGGELGGGGSTYVPESSSSTGGGSPPPAETASRKLRSWGV